MENVLSIYDTTTTLILLSGNPTIAILITLLNALLVTGARSELAAVAGSMITATMLMSYKINKINVVSMFGQICVIGVYYYNVYMGLIVQCIFDVSELDTEAFQTKTWLKIIMFLFMMMFGRQHIAICLTIALLHAFKNKIGYLMYFSNARCCNKSGLCSSENI